MNGVGMQGVIIITIHNSNNHLQQ